VDDGFEGVEYFVRNDFCVMADVLKKRQTLF
jgi:hypothetical protein